MVRTVSELPGVPSVTIVRRFNSSMNFFKALTWSGELSVIKRHKDKELQDLLLETGIF